MAVLTCRRVAFQCFLTWNALCPWVERQPCFLQNWLPSHTQFDSTLLWINFALCGAFYASNIMAILTRERERCVNSESAVHQRVQGHAPKTLPCASCGKSCVGQLAWQGPSSPWHLTTVQVCGVFLLLSWFSWGPWRPWMAMDGHAMGVRSHTSPSLQPLRMGSISARWIRRPGGAVANIYNNIYTLWLFNIAMENGLFIDGLPIKNGDVPWLC